MSEELVDPSAIDVMLQFAERGGLVALLTFIIVSGYKGWWVSGDVYRAMKKDRDEWKNMALQLGGMTDAFIKARGNEAPR